MGFLLLFCNKGLSNMTFDEAVQFTNNFPWNKVNPLVNPLVVSYDTNQEVPSCLPIAGKPKETNTMAIENTVGYLTDRAYTVNYTKKDALAKTFNLYVNNQPKTYKELIDAIKNDKFTLDAKITKRIDVQIEDDEGDFYEGAFAGIVWAGTQPDHDGYNKAVTELRAKYVATKDIITVMPAADGLKALNDFEAWVPSNQPAN